MPQLPDRLRSLFVATAFILAYLALDAASFIDPLHGLNITPWNPAPALGLVYLLRSGPAARWVVVVAMLLAERLIHGLQAPWWPGLLPALLLAVGYLLLAHRLRTLLPDTSLLNDRRTLLRWGCAIAGGTLLLSLLYLSALSLCGLIPGADWLGGVRRFWIGDSVGIAVAMPLFWWLTSAQGRSQLARAFRQPETPAYLTLSLLALWATFAGGSTGFQRAYLLLLPIIWASARQGMAGAIIAASLLQIAIITGVQLFDYRAVSLSEFQLLSLSIALIGFFIGTMVDEQRRTSEELRHSLRLAAAGEMAGALAHELNQPLTALTAYAAACETLLARNETGAQLHNALRGMLRESSRASDVLRRLRDFFRTGATRLEPLPVSEWVAQAITQAQARAQREGIELATGPLPSATLYADRLQLEVVLRNLLANACDALADTPTAKVISISGELLAGQRLQLTIRDSGPGLTAAAAARLFEPFHSSKANGLGLGLAISRAIIETHGGTLNGEPAAYGLFKIVLPVQENT